MKKMLALVLSFAMALSMVACGGQDSSSAATSSDTTGSSSAAAPSSSEATGTTDWSTSERINEIKEAGKLVLGTSADYPPFEFHTEIDGVDTITGFDVMLAQKIADSLGVELEVIDMSFDNLLMSLDRGDFDMVMAALAPTEERAKAVDFSDSYFHGSQVIVVRAEDADKYTTKESLAGCAVAAQKGAIQVPLANEVAGEANVVQLVKVGDMITELKSGKVEAVFLDSVIAGGYEAVHDDLVVVDIGLEFESEGNCVACKKGDSDLVAYINEVLASMSEDEINDVLKEAQALAGITEE